MVVFLCAGFLLRNQNIRMLCVQGYRSSIKNCISDKALEVAIALCQCRPSFFIDEHTENYPVCVGHSLHCIKATHPLPKVH